MDTFYNNYKEVNNGKRMLYNSSNSQINRYLEVKQTQTKLDQLYNVKLVCPKWFIILYLQKTSFPQLLNTNKVRHFLTYK